MAVRNTVTAFHKAQPSAGSCWLPGREPVSRSAAASERRDPKGVDDKINQMKLQKERKHHPNPIPKPTALGVTGGPTPVSGFPFLEPFPDLSLWTLLCRECVCYTQKPSSLHTGNVLHPRSDATRPVGRQRLPETCGHVRTRSTENGPFTSVYLRSETRCQLCPINPEDENGNRTWPLPRTEHKPH